MSDGEVSWNCFCCGDPVSGRHVYAWMRHHYKNDSAQDKAWRFHEPCFEKLLKPRGRVAAPASYRAFARVRAALRRLGVRIAPDERDVVYGTEYEVVDSEIRDPATDSPWTSELTP